MKNFGVTPVAAVQVFVDVSCPSHDGDLGGQRVRLLASGRDPCIRSGRLRSRPVRRVRIGDGGPCQAG
jgi:hypothetical protein